MEFRNFRYLKHIFVVPLPNYPILTLMNRGENLIFYI